MTIRVAPEKYLGIYVATLIINSLSPLYVDKPVDNPDEHLAKPALAPFRPTAIKLGSYDSNHTIPAAHLSAASRH